MSETVQLAQTGDSPAQSDKVSSAGRTLRRLSVYTVVRLVTLFIVVVVGVYLTILIANMGGYVDRIRSGQIREAVGMQILGNKAYAQMTPEQRNAIIEEMVALQEKRLGLDRPFIVRSFDFLKDALTLNLGRSLFMSSDSGSRQVRNIILERLPSTLVLFATADFILFFSALFLALALSRHYGSFFDRLVIALAPTSAVPAWFYGIFLLLIFAGVLGVLPFGGMVDAPPPSNPLLYGLSLAKHLILPVVAWLLSQAIISIFGWRTFFLIYSSEDYVDMAKAKGLPDRMIERRYILRPTLPNIVTSFALMLIAMWGGAIILETVFNWPGLGRLYNEAIGLNETSVIVGNTVIYAYLLAITVFLLEFIYALVDPRVKIGGGGARQ
jgi:peptide/nickel transport system permease protein